MKVVLLLCLLLMASAITDEYVSHVSNLGILSDANQVEAPEEKSVNTQYLRGHDWSRYSETNRSIAKTAPESQGN